MKVYVVGMDGRSASSAAKDRLHKILSSKLGNAGKPMQAALLTTTRNHFMSIYPGSRHYSPTKVQPKNVAKESASISIDIPGVTRAYHSLDIKPKIRKNLTIPMHSAAYGKKASDFSNLFTITKKDGKSFLVQKTGTGLAFLFFLAKRAFQPQDRRLMPSDQTYANNIFGRLKAYIDAQ